MQPNRNILRILSLVLFIITLSLGWTHSAAQAASRPHSVSIPNSVDPNYCLGVIISHDGLSVVSYPDGEGQNYNIHMKIVNNCGVTLTIGGSWEFTSSVQCPAGSFQGFYFSGNITALGPGKTLSVVDRSRVTFCVVYENGVEIARTLPQQITFYGNAHSSYTVGATTVPAYANTAVSYLY